MEVKLDMKLNFCSHRGGLTWHCKEWGMCMLQEVSSQLPRWKCFTTWQS